jgi:hypothetical protein
VIPLTHEERDAVERWLGEHEPQRVPSGVLSPPALSKGKLRECAVCGDGYYTRAAASKYCPSCRLEVGREKSRLAAAKRYAKRRAERLAQAGGAHGDGVECIH